MKRRQFIKTAGVGLAAAVIAGSWLALSLTMILSTCVLPFSALKFVETFAAVSSTFTVACVVPFAR